MTVVVERGGSGIAAVMEGRLRAGGSGSASLSDLPVSPYGRSEASGSGADGWPPEDTDRAALTSLSDLQRMHHEVLSRLPFDGLLERYRLTNRTLWAHRDASYTEKRSLAVCSLVGASLILRHQQMRARP